MVSKIKVDEIEGNTGTTITLNHDVAMASGKTLPAGNLTGTVADARISTLTASKLTGALPAISGANLTGIVAGTDWQSVVTGSTMTAVAGNGYPIDTTSNTCTITLPASASNGDKIIFADYARNWGTNGIEIDSNGLNYQGQDDTYTVEYGTDGALLHVVYSGATKGWIPTLDKAVDDVPSKGNTEGIFGFGSHGGNITNLVSTTGVVSADVTVVGTARSDGAATEYGGDKGIFSSTSSTQYTNLVSNTGVVASDVAGVGTQRANLAGCEYGGDKGIFGFGTGLTNVSNKISNAGVVASDTTGVGTARYGPGATEYGGDKGIFGYGYQGGTPAYTNVTNLVSNAGVVSSDQAAATGTSRGSLAACGYGYDKGIFGYGHMGQDVSMTNLISNVGVVASDVTGVGTGRYLVSACEYGEDKAIFGYGRHGGTYSAVTNLVSNTGVVSSNVTGVGTGRQGSAACSFN
jgi:hypothetical protein